VRLAIAGLYRARWSERILDECFHNLIADRPDLPVEHLDRTRRLMGIAIPDAPIEDYERLIDSVDLPDRDDPHVLAAAILAGADSLVTSNLGDFPSAALPVGLVALSPDAFILTLVRADPEAVAAVVDGLNVVGLTMSVAALRPLVRAL